MKMNEEPTIDPYEPPQSDITNEGLWDKLAYRDGDSLMVKAGYEGPKICALTGVNLEVEAKPLKVLMKTKMSWTFYFYMGLMMITIALIPVLDNLFVTFLTVILLNGGNFFIESKMPYFTIYCERKRRSRIVLNEVLGKILISIGICLILIFPGGSHGWLGLFGYGILMLSMIILVNKPLHYLSKENGFERYTGAHIRILNFLPKFSEEEDFESLLK